MANTIPVHANFPDDVRVHLLGVLTQAGVAVLPERQNDAELVCIDYFNVVHKLIAPRPREVRWSRELQARILPDDVCTGVRLIEALSLSGQSLERHLSERATRAHTHDWLLNNWGIHHLHLSPSRDRDELLFAVVERDTMYFLDVLNHGDMADVKLPEIILANWSELLTPMTGMKGGDPLTKEEIDSALRGGLQAIFPLSDGVCYFPRGGGVTTWGGSSARAVDRAHVVLRRAGRREQECRGKAERFARMLGLSEVRLRYDVTRDVAVEIVTGHHFMFDA